MGIPCAARPAGTRQQHIYHTVYVYSHLSQIQDIIPEFLRLFRGHSLDIDCPRRVLSFLDRLEQSLDTIIWVIASQLSSFVGREGLR